MLEVPIVALEERLAKQMIYVMQTGHSVEWTNDHSVE